MDLSTGEWDADLLDTFGVPRAMLPRIVGSSCVWWARRRASIWARRFPIAGIAGDQQAALFGQACFRPGLSKNTYGTGCFALIHTGSRRPVSKHRLLATRAASVGGPEYAIEGAIFIAGAAIQWLRDKLGIIRNAAESGELAGSVADTGGVYFVPAFVGLGAPHWDSAARGMLSGITAATGRARDGAGGAGGDCVPDQRTGGGDGGGRRRKAEGASSRRRRGGERFSDAVPGRHSGQVDRSAGGSRRPRRWERRIWRGWPPGSSRVSAMWNNSGGRKKRTSRG